MLQENIQPVTPITTVATVTPTVKPDVKPDAKTAAKINTGGVKKGKNIGTKIITSNRLSDGVVIYFTKNKNWTTDITAAWAVEGDAALNAVQIANAQEHIAVGAYLMDVQSVYDLTPSGRGRLRESIRHQGPTVVSAY